MQQYPLLLREILVFRLRAAMKENTGFTLIEIVVCVAILSVGLLGLMGLQATALKNVAGSYHRVQANLLAYDIADRVRLNFVADPNATAAEHAVNDQVLNQYQFIPFIIPITWKHAECLTTAGCSRLSMAQNDIFEWKTAVNNTLPLGRAGITCNRAGVKCTAPYNAVTDVFTVTISWDENHSAGIDNRDNINPSRRCFNNVVAQATLSSKVFQYDPCFRMDFKL